MQRVTMSNTLSALFKTNVSLSRLMFPQRQFFASAAKNTAETVAEQKEKAAVDTIDKPDEEIEKFKEELKTIKTDFAELKEKYQRSLAESENLRQRTRKQVEDTKLYGIQGFCKDLLDVADSLSVATESVPKDRLDENSHLKALHDGLIITHDQLLKCFNKHGLNKISPEEGEKFDPDIHQAMFQQPSDNVEKDNTVSIVNKVGYRLHNRTLRAALVGVYKAA